MHVRIRNEMAQRNVDGEENEESIPPANQVGRRGSRESWRNDYKRKETERPATIPPSSSPFGDPVFAASLPFAF